MFWRHKKNDPKGAKAHDKDEKDFKHEGEPELEDSLDEDHGDELHNFDKDEADIDLVDSQEIEETPLPDQTSYEVVPGEPEPQDVGGGWWSRLTSGLSKSSTKLTQGISDLVTKKKLDQETLDALEELLISADLGPKTAARLVGELSADRYGKDISEQEIKEILAQSITNILEPVAGKLNLEKMEDGPNAVLVCGVNGVGKTTTIGKLAHQLSFKDHKSVLLAAGDTFRAAAVEQLEVWAKRTHVPVLTKEIGSDAASVAYEAYAKAQKDNTDIVLIDTAGRLHNKSHLMEELQKMRRVLNKQNENAPHEVILVLDATTGQNAHSQVRIFKDMIDVTGLIVTKLDGSARGGVLVSLADEFGLPVYAIGVGEQAEDMQPFHPREFANALLGIKM